MIPSASRKTAFAVLVVVLSSALFAMPAHARSLEIEDFRADIAVEADGTVRVEERIRVAFQGHWNGIFRWIPYGYTYPNGLRGMIQLRLDAVEDGAGQPLEHWTKRSRGRLEVKIRVPGAADATREVVLRYRAYDVVRLQEGKDEDYGAYDELYWNVTGNDWVAPIRKASARITLPADVPPDRVRVGAYVGYRGARDRDYTVSRGDDGAVLVEADRVLAPGSGLTVAVTFPPGHVAKPGALQRILWWFRANWQAFVPLLPLGLWLVVWYLRGRDDLAQHTIVPDWRGPADLTPTEMGVLTDDSVDQRDVTAAIVDLAVRGVLRIEERKRDDWDLVLVPGGREQTRLAAFEKKLLDALFRDDATTVRMTKLKHKFYKDLGRIKDSLLDGMVGKQLFARRPDKVANAWTGWTFLVLVGLVIFGFASDATWIYWVVAVPAVLVMFGLAGVMPRRTRKGLDALARVKGVEEYIRTAERERVEREDASLFDRVLPMAIALGLSDRWAEAFEDLYERAPEWYRPQGGGTLDAWALTRAMDGMNRGVGQSLLAAPRSSGGGRSWGGGYSGGSGFSGGSSGGGFGGGGGGGW